MLIQIKSWCILYVIHLFYQLISQQVFFENPVHGESRYYPRWRMSRCSCSCRTYLLLGRDAQHAQVKNLLVCMYIGYVSMSYFRQGGQGGQFPVSKWNPIYPSFVFMIFLMSLWQPHDVTNLSSPWDHIFQHTHHEHLFKCLITGIRAAAFIIVNSDLYDVPIQTYLRVHLHI